MRKTNALHVTTSNPPRAGSMGLSGRRGRSPDATRRDRRNDYGTGTRAMSDDRAPRPDASRAIGTGCASGRVGLGRKRSDEAKREQAANNHRGDAFFGGRGGVFGVLAAVLLLVTLQTGLPQLDVKHCLAGGHRGNDPRHRPPNRQSRVHPENVMSPKEQTIAKAVTSRRASAGRAWRAQKSRRTGRG